MKKDAPRLQYVRGEGDPRADVFLRMGGAYLLEIDPARTIDHERFLRSILRGQGKPERWLALFERGSEIAGFSHFKIDREERPGWGYVMEFYIVPDRRSEGLGRSCLELVLARMRASGAPTVWLAADPGAEAFWAACGFRETGELERDQKIMTASVAE